MFVDMQPADYQPELPPDLRHGIGIVGCGILVSGLQMPAYKKAGYRVVACAEWRAKRSSHDGPPPLDHHPNCSGQWRGSEGEGLSL